MIWFTADTHFGHKAIINYEGREPGWEERFLCYCEQNIARGDTFYHLGDFALGKDWPDEWFTRIPGQKFLIRGNHDYKRVESLAWTWVGDYKEIKIDGTKVVLCHYPLARWNRSHYGSFHLHGHCHGDYDGQGRSLDVGIDSCIASGLPLSWDEIYKRLSACEPIDHHTRMPE